MEQSVRDHLVAYVADALDQQVMSLKDLVEQNAVEEAPQAETSK